MRTALQAAFAEKTSIPKIEHFRAHRLALRVVAPRASQRATLKKDSRADSRAVVQREFLDVENQS
jgi:hypothetical protein